MKELAVLLLKKKALNGSTKAKLQFLCSEDGCIASVQAELCQVDLKRILEHLTDAYCKFTQELYPEDAPIFLSNSHLVLIDQFFCLSHT